MKLLVLFFIFAFSANTFASIHLEPYVGIGSSSYSITVSGSDDDNDGSYQALGGKVGWGLLGFDFGVDYEMDNSNDFTRNNLSAYAAFEFPILIRVWAEYVLSSKFDPEDTAADLSLVSGSSLGVAFTGLPFVSLNLELEKTEYDGDINNNNVKVDWVSYLLSVSMPFDL